MSLDDFDPFARWREPSPLAMPERAPGRRSNTERLACRPGVVVVRDMLTTATGSLAEVDAHAPVLAMLIANRHCALAAERAGQLRYALRYAKSQFEQAFLRAEADAPHLAEQIAGFYMRVEAEEEEFDDLLERAPTAAEESNPATWCARLDRLEEADALESDDAPMGEVIDATELFRGRGMAGRMRGDR
jgi:hypothetical protein